MAKLGEYGDKLQTMTAQEAFDAAATHLLEQGCRSESDGRCRYNGDGVCCAAAPFIRNYSPELEDIDWLSVVRRKAASKNHLDLIEKLQRIHDSTSPKMWYECLEYLATKSI